MKILRVHLVEIITAILFIILVLFFYRSDRVISDIAEDMSYDQDWVYAGEDTIKYEILPESIQVSGNTKEVVLQKRLPENTACFTSIGFYTSHQLVEVFIEGKMVYERKAPSWVKSRTPGNCWNFVQLSEEYSGKMLEVKLTNCYHSGYVNIPKFVYGRQSTILINQMKSKCLSLLISFVLFAMGLILVAGWFTLGRKMHFHRGIPWLGLFTIHFAVWSAFETQIPMLMFGRELLCNHITIMSLKLMPLPMIYFLDIVYNKKNRQWMNVLAWVSVLDFAGSFLGQCFGWFDFRQTLWFTHILGISVAVTVIVLGILARSGEGGKTFEQDKKFWLNVVCIGVVSLCVILDALNYYYSFYDDAAYFSRIGCLLYIFVLSKQFLNDSVKLIQVGKQAEAIREEAALDGLTLLKNRKCFEMDLHQIHSKDFREYGVVMFDLNNLKRMNDLYGHGMGDCYIITGSEIIRDVFGDIGEIYRIGGDEFCLISGSITEEIYEEKRKQMCDWLANLRGTQVKDFMQIASGFAKYNRSTDMNLQDTVGRADEQMYRCKRAQKETQNNDKK